MRGMQSSNSTTPSFVSDRFCRRGRLKSTESFFVGFSPHEKEKEKKKKKKKNS